MIPYQHQEELSNEALSILREHGIAYLAMEERTGKTLLAILCAEKSTAENILIVTKKKALDGWQDTLCQYPVSKHYVLVNYHKVGTVAKHKFGLIILDESHNYISSYPKPGTIWKELKPICINTPILYSSATPHAQGMQQLFHQFALSSWSPWYKHTNFYNWFQLYGKPYQIEVGGIMRTQYDRVKSDMIENCVKHLFITKTRAELGFEHEPEDQLHYIELAGNTKAVYNVLVKDGIIPLSVGVLVADNPSKLRTSLHQLEGGTIKIDNNYFTLGNTEKIDYILKVFGDSKDLVIMYNFKQEAIKLATYFKNATILQATSYAEGVDLHKFANLVIYSQDYSTARHTQRRARQCNMKRNTPINIHFLLVAKGISSQVYKTVSVNKKNYVDSRFSKEFL